MLLLGTSDKCMILYTSDHIAAVTLACPFNRLQQTMYCRESAEKDRIGRFEELSRNLTQVQASTEQLQSQKTYLESKLKALEESKSAEIVKLEQLLQTRPDSRQASCLDGISSLSRVSIIYVIVPQDPSTETIGFEQEAGRCTSARLPASSYRIGYCLTKAGKPDCLLGESHSTAGA